MRETSVLNNLNCKMQAHARVCKENDGKADLIDRSAISSTQQEVLRL